VVILETTAKQVHLATLASLARKENKVQLATRGAKVTSVPPVLWETKEIQERRVGLEQQVTVEVLESRVCLALVARLEQQANRGPRETRVPLEPKVVKVSKDPKVTTETRVDRVPPVLPVLMETRVLRG